VLCVSILLPAPPGGRIIRVWIFTVIPIVAAALAILCAVAPSTGRLIWLALAFSALSVVLSPVASGEWFYQRTEQPAYDAAVARGDFTSFDDFLAQHDPHRPQRMIAGSMALLAVLSLLALLRHWAPRRRIPATLSAAVSATVVVAAVTSIFLVR